MDPFEFSVSPYFNDVIRAAQVLDCDPTQEDNRRDFAEHLEFIAKFAQFLAQQFHEAIKIRPKTELSKQAPPRFKLALQEFTQALNWLNSYLHSQQRQELLDGLDLGRTSLKSMLDIFEEMRVEEEAFPQFSSSPFVQELVRVATGVAKQQYPPEVLKEKLEWMRSRHKTFCQDFQDLKKSPKESDELDTLLPQAEKYLAQMGEGLDNMALFFKDRDRKHLKEGCAVLLQASERLVKVQERLMTVSVAQPVACTKCSAMNPGGSKTCQKCGAVLPEIAGLSKQTLELREQQAGRPTYAYLSRLEGAVEGRLQGYISVEALRDQVESFAKRAEQGRRNLDQMKAPQNYPDETTREVCQRAHAMLDEGTQKIVAGVNQLRRYFTSEEVEDLVQGMEQIYAGSDIITASQALRETKPQA